MSYSSGPGLVTSNLVFAYDMQNTVKSWKGAPTTNLITSPTNFSTNWVNSNSTVIEANRSDPFGGTNAALLTDNFTGNDGSFIENAFTITPSSTTVYTASLYVKKGTSSIIDFYIFFVGNSTKGSALRYNFNTDTVSSSSADGGGAAPTNPGRQILNNGWVRIYFSVADSTNGLNNTIQYRLYPGGRDINLTGSTYVYGPQCEISSYPTPFVAGSRTNTQSIVDLTSTSTITANSLTYATDNSNFSFNGTSNFISITNNAAIRPSTELTIECVIRPTATPASWSQLIGYGQADFVNGNYLLFLETGTTISRAVARVNNTEYRCNTNFTVPLNQFTFITYTMRCGDAIRSYFNGVANITTTLPAGTFTYNQTTSPYQIGSPGGSWFPGQIPIMRIHNRALSANEVFQNFNIMRGRFGL